MILVFNGSKKNNLSSSSSLLPPPTSKILAATTLLFLVILLASNETKFCNSFSPDNSKNINSIGGRFGRRTNKNDLWSGNQHSIGDSNHRRSSGIRMSSSSTESDAVVTQTTRDALEGKSILLTGASGGLGAQLALQIANHCKPKTLVLSGRKQDALEQIAAECKAGWIQNSGGKSLETADAVVKILTADLSDKDSVRALGESAVSACGGVIDVLVNCGGVSSRSDFVDTRLEVDERVMQINFFSGASLAKAVVPTMIQSGNGGTILWISSVQGLMGIPSRTSYAASKFAVQGYCEALRAEVATSGVEVHCVSPGYIRTNLSRSAVTGDGSAYDQMDATTANGADPREVAVEILDRSLSGGEADFVVAATASAKIAIWLRALAPGLLRKLLVQRFEKAKRKQQEAISSAATTTDKKLD
mmetsp:Transcript_7690/g.19143  ORF Transcript_7690/g.19143 Transcript_7690/m.19143 type:complete len:418 (-) Transcript_7690:42-1295(-)